MMFNVLKTIVVTTMLVVSVTPTADFLSEVFGQEIDPGIMLAAMAMAGALTLAHRINESKDND
jgi:hypothetical protein